MFGPADTKITNRNLLLWKPQRRCELRPDGGLQIQTRLTGDSRHRKFLNRSHSKLSQKSSALGTPQTAAAWLRKLLPRSGDPSREKTDCHEYKHAQAFCAIERWSTDRDLPQGSEPESMCRYECIPTMPKTSLSTCGLSYSGNREAINSFAPGYVSWTTEQSRQTTIANKVAGNESPELCRNINNRTNLAAKEKKCTPERDSKFGCAGGPNVSINTAYKRSLSLPEQKSSSARYKPMQYWEEKYGSGASNTANLAAVHDKHIRASEPARVSQDANNGLHSNRQWRLPFIAEVIGEAASSASSGSNYSDSEEGNAGFP